MLLIDFLIIDFHLLNPAVIAHIFMPLQNFFYTIPIGISSEEVKVEIEIHAVVAKAKIRKCSR